MNTSPQKKKSLEATIVRLLQQEDQRAVSLIYKNYATVLYGVIFNIVQSESSTQEVLQDCFIKIWRKSKLYNSNKGRLFTWMINIARNAAIDKIRSATFQREQQTDSLDVEGQQRMEGLIYSTIEDSGLRKIINSLDEKHRVLIDFIYFQGYSQREIARHLMIPVGTVKSRIRFAINELRTKLNREQQLLVLQSA